MALDKVNISISDGGLGFTGTNTDGVAALVISAPAAVGSFNLGAPVKVNSLKQVRDLGLTAAYDVTNGCAVYAQIAEFYEGAPEGAPLWVVLYVNTTTATTVFAAAGLMDTLFNTSYANGDVLRLVGIVLNRPSSYTATITTGVEADIWAAMQAAAAYAVTKSAQYRNCSFFIDGGRLGGSTANPGTDWTSTARDLRSGITAGGEFVTLVAGASKAIYDLTTNQSVSTFRASNSVGLFVGRLAGGTVSDDTSAVSDGAAKADLSAFYVGWRDAGTPKVMIGAWNYLDSELEALHDKGYATVRQFPTRKGWYWTGANNCAPVTSDFQRVPYVRVAYKARRIAYDVLIQRLSQKSPSDATTGKISKAYAKAIETEVNNALAAQLVATGDVSAVEFAIDTANSGGTSGTINATLQIVPVGYNRTINVTLAYAATL